ncbi:MAG: hypothetical protein Q7U47_12145 [Paludibacter sp.]|nr:hypothetical protein [Paludibacter sp.]
MSSQVAYGTFRRSGSDDRFAVRGYLLPCEKKNIKIEVEGVNGLKLTYNEYGSITFNPLIFIKSDVFLVISVALAAKAVAAIMASGSFDLYFLRKLMQMSATSPVNSNTIASFIKSVSIWY